MGTEEQQALETVYPDSLLLLSLPQTPNGGYPSIILLGYTKTLPIHIVQYLRHVVVPPLLFQP
jgi:hypothetical protein